tara:strand:+ start:514 stop:885 length:372 start_codon:yes stop_codon:yes gene_type:complete
MSQVSKSPEAIDRTLGALTLPTLNTMLDASRSANTRTTSASMPARLPSLSSNGTRIEILKLAKGATEVRSLFVGTMYGSAGVTITLLAIGVAGGYENTDHFVLSVRAAAIDARNVVMAGISPP